MPLYKQYNVDDIEVSVWSITETFDELLRLAPEACAETCLRKFSSEKRRKEWLAVRVMVQRLFGYDVRVGYDASGKPVLEGKEGFVSISHTDGFAVVAFSPTVRVGVDAELLSRDVLAVSRRFVRDGALDDYTVGNAKKAALLHWCAKEALFKIVGDLGGNFKDNIAVAHFWPAEIGELALELVGVECGCDKYFTASYSNIGNLLIVVCRRAR